MMKPFGADFLAARNAWRNSATDRQPLTWSITILFALVVLQLGLPLLGQMIVAVVWSINLAATGINEQEIMAALLADTAFIKASAYTVFLTLIPTSILTAFLAYRATGWNGGERQKAMALNYPDLGWFGWAIVVVGFIAFMGAAGFVIKYLSGNLFEIGEVEKLVQMLRDDYRAKILLPLAIGLFGPVAEEFIFRGPFFSRLLATRLAMIGTVFVTALLFSLMHVSYFAQGFTAGLVAVLPLFLMGIMLGWLRLRFGSIWVPIVCHCLWNMLASLVLFNVSFPGAT